uniref:Uncharacterized protein n=1 Tax=Myripristis murdjan TaxID=586833 RepID=A0A667XN43_9TELE
MASSPVGFGSDSISWIKSAALSTLQSIRLFGSQILHKIRFSKLYLAISCCCNLILKPLVRLRLIKKRREGSLKT